MTIPKPPNPYKDMLPRELAAAAYRIAEELNQKRARTPVERQDLVDRCTHMLLSLGSLVDPRMSFSAGEVVPGIDLDNLVEGYADWAERECAAVRRVVLMRAADACG